MFCSCIHWPHYWAERVWLRSRSIAAAGFGTANTHKYLSDSIVDWAQQLPHIKQWVDAHPGEECWLAYSAYPDLRPQAYGIPCHPLPTAHTGGEILPTEVPETIHGNLLLSADDLEACDWPSDQLNIFERFRWMPMA